MRARRPAGSLQLRDLEGNIVGTAEESEAATKLISTYNSTEFGVPQPGTEPPTYAWLGAEGVSSEPSQGSGASTQSGASYVPEIGRALQTGPIASPGAFPNGTGGVGIVSAPYLGAAVNEFTEIAVREQAASEEAKKTEGEERAYEQEGFCEQDPDGSACHVDGPGEGNCEVNCLTVIGGEAEEYDPEGLASYNTTMNRAKELRADGVKGLAVGLLLDLGLPGGAEGGADYAAAMELSALSLESCVDTGKKTPGEAGKWGTCFINENKKLGIPLEATAEFCEYRSPGKSGQNYYYCSKSGDTRKGPWYP